MRHAFLLCLCMITGYAFAQQQISLPVTTGDSVRFYSGYGQMLKNEKHGLWIFYSYLRTDTTKRIDQEALYHKGKLKRSKANFYAELGDSSRLSGWNIYHFKDPGKMRAMEQYTSGKLHTLTKYCFWRFAFVKQYHPNGQLKAKGRKWRRKMPKAGCDAGMKVYDKVGVWRYYDESGKEISSEKHPRFFSRIGE